MKRSFLAAAVLMLSVGATAQKENTEFKPSGKPTATIFSDARMRFYDGKQSTAFEIKRAYLGYSYTFSPTFSAKVVFDITNDSTLKGSHYNVYVKNAFLRYKTGALTVLAGMIGTDLYTEAESMWGKRYLAMNVNELLGLGSSADIGVGVRYNFSPKVYAMAQIIDGEGYKKMQADSTVKVSLGVAYLPVKGLTLRAYADYMHKDVTEFTFNFFAGYQTQRFTIGGEFAYQAGQKMKEDYDVAAVSLWGNYNFSKHFSAFARYDHNFSMVPSDASASAEAWGDAKELSRYIVGVEYCPIKQVRISPNVQISDPKIVGSKTTTDAMISLGVFF